MSAWEVMGRGGSRNRADGVAPPDRDIAPEGFGRGVVSEDTAFAHLDELINERSAATAEELEELERARVEALRTAPLRLVVRARMRGVVLAQGVATVSRSAAGAVATGTSAFVSGTAAAAGAGRRVLAERSARRRELMSQDPEGEAAAQRRRRKFGAAAATALVVAAPAAADPAPWASLVGASAGGAGGRQLRSGLPDDPFAPHDFQAASEGPLGNAPAGTATALDTTANPAAAGLPLGNSDRSIPATVLLAYQKAANRLAVEDPGCHLSWTLIAGIGRVESNHARSWGGTSRLSAAGVATPTILGPRLDGSVPGTARLNDTDGGRLDGDPQYDRAVGPMQFVPGTWKLIGRDGNGDGVADPNNVWDAALTTGSFLCDGGRDLSNPAAQAAAVFAYNPSSLYVQTVLAWSTAYATGASVDLGVPTGTATSPAVGTGGLPPGFSVPLTGSSPISGPSVVLPAPSTQPAAPSFPAAPRAAGGSAPRVNPVVPISPTRPPVSSPPTHGPTPTPPSSGSGAPPPAPTPPPSPKPTPTPFKLTLAGVTASRGNRAATGTFPTVTVTVTLDATAGGTRDLVLTLTDKSGLPLGTVSAQGVTFGAGSKSVQFSVPGRILGDAGVDGPYSATVGVGGDTLGTRSVGAGWKAQDFPGYTPSLSRIRQRVTEFAQAKMITAGDAQELQRLLRRDNQLPRFVQDLQNLEARKTIATEAFVRLQSLAERRQNSLS